MIGVRTIWFVILVVFQTTSLQAQINQSVDGQLSVMGSWSPKALTPGFAAARYLPEYSITYTKDSIHFWDGHVAANLTAGGLKGTDSVRTYADASPYRGWLRYSTRRLELRVGLQKIDFGVARLIRPLQWFNQIDPRDPLQLTNGVYAVLGRYYFLNNANLWIWSLYGNEAPRGFDLFGTNDNSMEAGGRFQWPLKTGEAAFSYHYREVGSSPYLDPSAYPAVRSGEDRLGFDLKIDRTVGLAFESAFIRKRKRIGGLTESIQLNLGVDYTFGIGNGLNVLIEEYAIGYMDRGGEDLQMNHVIASMVSYPFGLFDQLQLITYAPWNGSDPAVILNYQHTFKRLVAYTMLYYNPESTGFVQQNDLVNQFQGPGIRLLLVYNH